MTVELTLIPQGKISFESVYPFQLFQIWGSPSIWVKVSDRYARIISQQLSQGRQFQADELVVLLVPDDIEEEE